MTISHTLPAPQKEKKQEKKAFLILQQWVSAVVMVSSLFSGQHQIFLSVIF